jgi:hypothetical protein
VAVGAGVGVGDGGADVAVGSSVGAGAVGGTDEGVCVELKDSAGGSSDPQATARIRAIDARAITSARLFAASVMRECML